MSTYMGNDPGQLSVFISSDYMSDSPSLICSTAGAKKVFTDITKSLSSTIENLQKVFYKNLSTTWVGDVVPFKQTISINGITENSIINIGVSSTCTKEQFEQFNQLMLSDGGQTLNAFTLNSWGDKNSIEIPITVTISESKSVV